MSQGTNGHGRGDSGREFGCGSSRRRIIQASGVATVVGLAGCTGGGGDGGGTGAAGTPTPSGTGGTATPLNYGGGSGGTPTPDLGTEWVPGEVVRAAREEGEVIINTPIDQPDLEDPFKVRFEEQFPGITMRPQGMGPSEISSKLVAEKKSGNINSDVVVNTQGPLRAIAGQDVYKEFDGDHWLVQQAEQMGYPAPFWDTQAGSPPYELPGFGIPQTLIYNTDKITESEAPAKYEDLGNDKWTGGMGITMEHPANLTMTGGLFATLYKRWGPEKWERVVGNIMDNNPQLTSAGSQSYRVLIQGERALSPNLINDYVSQVNAGEDPPAALKWLDPPLMLTISTAVVNGAPHPNAAMVLASWFFSEEGQQTIGDTGRTPVHGPTASTHDNFREVIPEDVTIRPMAFNNPTYNGQGFIENPEAWGPLLQEHFGSP